MSVGGCLWRPVWGVYSGWGMWVWIGGHEGDHGVCVCSHVLAEVGEWGQVWGWVYGC